jgi:tRNA1Val (adenine37-N6)-methyltransferase
MPPFVFKQFAIEQDNCAMKVGTDAVLLGAWANVNEATTILDIGTGTGILALMLAQKNTKAIITAIDIDVQAVEQATENFNNSIFKNQLSALHCTLQNYTLKNANKRFDCIISNPPFFENSTRATNVARNLARHTDSLSITDLMQCVATMLATTGVFYIVLPASLLTNVQSMTASNLMHITNIMYIKTKQNKAPKRVLLALRKIKKELKEEQLIIELDERHKFSVEYMQLTMDYYVRF